MWRRALSITNNDVECGVAKLERSAVGMCELSLYHAVSSVTLYKGRRMDETVDGDR